MKEISYSQNLVLLIQLDDHAPTLERILMSQMRLGSSTPQEWPGGVFRLASSVFLFDETKTHSAFVRACSALAVENRPYLCVRISSTDALLGNDELLEEAIATLRRLSVRE